MATDGLQITSLVHSATRHCLQLVCKLNMNICFFACHSHSHTTSSLFSLSVFFVMSPLSFTNTGYNNKDDDLVMEWENNKDAAAAATAATATNNSDLSAPQVCHGKCPSQPASSLSCTDHLLQIFLIPPDFLSPKLCASLMMNFC
jgi:hypothetical protein